MKNNSCTDTTEAKLKREIVKYAMQRLRHWKKDNPQGLVPEGHPQAMRYKSGRLMVEACLALEKLRAAK